jgi:O-antigen/teichoic acid export membrane protein
MHISSIIFQAFPLRKLASFRDRFSRRHAAELTWLSVGQAVSLLLGILTIKLLTSMGPSEYGTYALVGTIGALVSSILHGPLEQGFVRFYYDYANKGLARRFINLFYRCLLVGGVFCVAGGFVAAFTNSWTGNHLSPLLILAATLFVLLSSTANPFNPMLNVLRRRRENALLQVLERLLGLLFLFAIFHILGRTVTAALLALCVAMGIVVAVKSILLSSFLPDGEPPGVGSEDRDYGEMFKVIRRFGTPFAIWGLAGWLQSNSERWVILTFLSSAEVGIYAVMIALANYAVTVPQGILTQFATPFIYERFSGPRDEASVREGYLYYRYFVLSSTALVGLVTLAALVVGKGAIILLSSEQYAGCWYLLPLLCLGTGLFHIGQALCLVGLSLNLPHKYMFPKIASGVLAVVLNVLLLKLFGMPGIAMSVCMAGFVYLLLIAEANVRIRAAARASDVVAA